MNKAILILIGVLLFVCACTFVFITVLSPKNQTTLSGHANPNGPTYSNTSNNTTSVTTGTAPAQTTGANTMPLRTFNGKTLMVRNFKADSTTIADSINKGNYFLGPHPYEGVTDPTASSNPPYVINYNDKTQSFTISLLQKPLGATRQAVEQSLLHSLNLTQDQLCQLNYTVATPTYVDGTYAGIDLGFSFCPGATQLP